MNRLERSPLHGSAVALALSGAASLVSLLLRSHLEPGFFLLFEIAVWVSAWCYGLTAGLVAAAASTIALAVIFAAGGGPQGVVATRTGTFLMASTFIAWATASWRQSRRVLASTLSSIEDAVAATDARGRVTLLNPVAQTLTGWTEDEARNRPVEDVVQLVDERTRQKVENPLTRALRDRAPAGTAEDVLLRSRSGAETPIEHSAAPVRGYSGQVRGAILVFRDTRKRRQFEEQSTHARKMDAMARLAGGVAGDFNNLLTVISGYAEMLRLKVAPESYVQKYVDEISEATDRAAAVTRHLLAFSLGTGGDPRVLNLNLTVARIEPMLRRLLGPKIELTMLPGAGLGHVRVDSSQIEQVVVNLAANARDAMPNGGKLVLETANQRVDEHAGKRMGLKPGEYVMLAMSDTGTGMTAEVRSRIFEPFFTTKGPGTGTGLGLATAYGSVKQADGQITVYSQPDCGTIFEVYLPRASAPAEPLRKMVRGGTETILLVEDEDSVRTLCGAVLQAHGYKVLAAGSGEEAVAIYERQDDGVNLLLTDIVMSEMNGFELARRLAGRAPELRILYMSGYRETTSDTGEKVTLLSKPFTPDELLERVRKTLDDATAH